MQFIYGIETLLLCVIIFISVVFSLKISFSNYETNLYEIHDHQICNLLKYCVLFFLKAFLQACRKILLIEAFTWNQHHKLLVWMN